MGATRTAAVELAKEGKIKILSKGEVVPHYDVKGPIRLRLSRSGCRDDER